MPAGWSAGRPGDPHRSETTPNPKRGSVTDDVDGFDPGARALGRGLTNMSDRLDALGGTLTVESSPGGGTTVSGALLAVPIL